MKNLAKRIFRLPWAKRSAWLAGGLVLLSVVSTPLPASGQFGISTAVILAALQTLDSTIQSAIGAPMKMLTSGQQAMQQFEAQDVYPIGQITQMQSLSVQSLSQMQSMQNVMSTPVSSAQVPVNQTLEAAMLSGDTNDVGSINSDFQNSFGPLPSSNQASPQTLQAIDASDAVSEECMKKSIELDQLAQEEISAAQTFQNELKSAAPGNAAIVGAQAAAWILQGHGYSQSAMAQILRAQAVEAGISGMAPKASSAASANAAGGLGNLNNLLSPQQ